MIMQEDDSKADNLMSNGWTERFIASEPRLSEAVEMYKEAGFEVHLEPLPKGSQCGECSEDEGKTNDCRICFKGSEDNYKIIYTRPIQGHTSSEDGIF